MKNTITVVITAYNEENNIADCINSAKILTNNVVVIDTESTDNTVQIARSLNCTVYSFPYKTYVEPARNFAFKKVTSEWIFILDADERITKDLAQEIQEHIKTNSFTYYKIPRKNIFAGVKWLQHGGWCPDYVIRLIKKDTLINWPKEIHSTPHIKGQMGYLKAFLIHHAHPSLENMVNKTAVYENIESNLLYKAGRKVNTLVFYRKFLGELYRRLIKWQGYMDGRAGIIESIYQAYSKTITYLFLYEKYKEKSTHL